MLLDSLVKSARAFSNIDTNTVRAVLTVQYGRPETTQTLLSVLVYLGIDMQHIVDAPEHLLADLRIDSPKTCRTPSSESRSPRRSSITCSICLSPVSRGSQRGPLSPLCSVEQISSWANVLQSPPPPPLHRGRFRTPCCKQLFHQECMKNYKTIGIGSSIAHTNCPLCRSEQRTGLTPCGMKTGELHQPRTAETQLLETQPCVHPYLNGVSRPRSGFVSGRAMHTAISQRAAAARLAVQRSLAARQAAVMNMDAGSPVNIDISSPYQEVLRQRC